MGEQQKKRKQHYVWKHYLKGWAVDGGTQIWCMREGKDFPTSVDNIAQQGAFYRVMEMTERDFAIVEKLAIEGTVEPLRTLAREWVPTFRAPHELKRAYEASGRTDAVLEKQLDTAINNLEETLHCRIEDPAVPILAALRMADVSIFKDPQTFIDFCLFVAFQYFRTNRMAKTAATALGSLPGFNADAAWGLMRTIFSTNVGAAFMVRQNQLKLTFLNAPPEVEFIAGDQPLINLRAVDLPEGKQAEEVEIYYPLTPKIALLMDFQAVHAGTEKKTLTPEEVLAYNGKIASASAGQYYATSNEGLSALPGKWKVPS